jgi:hypothetical protein
MLKRALAVLTTAFLLTGTLQAQETKPPAKPAKPAAQTPAPRPEGQPVNIKLDLTITDQAGPGDPAKRTVSMVVADRQSGSVRSGGVVRNARDAFNVNLNVDATPTIIGDGTIRLHLALEYVPKPGTENATSGEGRATLNERLGLIVQSGRPMMLSQASDPTSDRKITVELVATIIK